MGVTLTICRYAKAGRCEIAYYRAVAAFRLVRYVPIFIAGGEHFTVERALIIGVLTLDVPAQAPFLLRTTLRDCRG